MIESNTYLTRKGVKTYMQ
uniref:Uncharacterized protein n=1 Tax=Anguilla anguilla TaxID=7936 RepID=A0A0E9TXL4_ANGAN